MIPKRCVVSSLFVASCASSLFAQGAANNPLLQYTQEHHWTFSTIGDVGNAPYVSSQGIGIPPRVFGGVEHAYRISTTEVTWGQYFEFLQAYAPVTTLGSSLEGGPIRYQGTFDGVPYYTVEQPERLNEPAAQSWRIWARFCNWLDAGGPDLANPASADFETGVYDTSTFGRIPNGPTGPYYTDQDAHDPDARFWIPTHDELTKATYYDPNRYGEGQGGYWQYGHGADEPPLPGDPALGGQTNAGYGDELPPGQTLPLDVGSYPGVLSPWGLLDSAGGIAEWAETWTDEDPFEHNERYVVGPNVGFSIALGDIDALSYGGPTVPYFGLRLAAAVPAPGAGAGAVPLFALSALVRVRRKR